MTMQERPSDNGFLPIEEVKSLWRSVPQYLIRIQHIPDPKEMWGVVTLDGLPFYFRASKRLGLRDVNLTAAGEGVAVSEKYTTNWWSHAPYTPFNFVNPFKTESISDLHREHFLQAFGVSRETVIKAREAETLDNLYRDETERRKELYEAVSNKYTGDYVYATAVSLACEENSSGKITASIKEWSDVDNLQE